MNRIVYVSLWFTNGKRLSMNRHVCIGRKKGNDIEVYHYGGVSHESAYRLAKTAKEYMEIIPTTDGWQGRRKL